MEHIKGKLVLPCIRGVLGDWVYYSSIMTTEQISKKIKAAKDIRESKKLDEVLQRDLKKRKKQIADYLLQEKSRFFNSIVVGVFDGIPQWIPFDISDKAKELNYFNESDIFNECMGLLVFNGDEKMFAIDGQHRVAGISIAYEEFLKAKNNNIGIGDDQYSVIFIAHIDDKPGRKRTRKLFSDINKNAKVVAPGDRIKIDEDDINAIITRKLYAEYPFFKGGDLISLTEEANLERDDFTHFTNLLSLHSVAKRLKPLFRKKRGTKNNDIENIETFYKIVTSFLDFVIENVKEYRDFFIDNKLDLKDARVKNTYLLFRPVGLILLSRLYTYFSKKNELEFLKNNINKIGFIFPESPFNKILWTRGKMDVKGKNQTFAYNLSLYLMGYIEDKKEQLEEIYQDITKDESARLPQKII